ncbi:MAG TPA: hypothetical protein VG755_18650 [Nannocystaceae bacterium]|nr:hypothetical protein [Nannocystaceae bacterium]
MWVASAGALRWIERLAGVALGSLVTAWWMRSDPPADPPAEAIDAPAPVVIAPLVSAPPVVSDVAPAAVAVPTSDAIAAPSEAPTLAPPSDDATTRDATTIDGATPTLPLPRMPGSARLSDAARFDDASKTWVLRASYRVHAHPPQVLSFYAKALADAGLVVTEGQDPVKDDGTAIAYLYGRNDRVRAQISVRTQGNELDARIGILWRERG